MGKRRKPVKQDGFLSLSDDLLEDIFLRLPPSSPACLVRASAVGKNWRRILADAGFRRRYREFHATPPVLGLFREDASFVRTTSVHLPALRDYRPRWGGATVAVDCRHGRALLTPGKRHFIEDFDFRVGSARASNHLYLTVFNPLTGHKPRIPFPDNDVVSFSAAVLCAAHGTCDHHGCQRGHFRVAMVTTDQYSRVTSGWLYSSENCLTWTKLTSVHHPNVTKYTDLNQHMPSILVGDALYFNMDGVVKCDLATLCLSMFDRPTDAKGRLMTAQDGGLGFAAVEDFKNLTLWSMETAGPEGASIRWAKLRVIRLNLSQPNNGYEISGIAEGTQVIFVEACGCFTFMVDLKSKRARKVAPPGTKVFPYISFYMPAMEAASTSQEQ